MKKWSSLYYWKSGLNVRISSHIYHSKTRTQKVRFSNFSNIGPSGFRIPTVFVIQKPEKLSAFEWLPFNHEP